MALVAHAGILLGVWSSPHGHAWLLSLNAFVSFAALFYAASRVRYVEATDWPYLGLVAFELTVLLSAFWAFRGSRPAAIWSYTAFGLHACATLAAVMFSFGFEISELI